MLDDRDEEYVESMKSFIIGCFEDLEAKITKPDLPLTVALNELMDVLESNKENVKKISTMVNELKGCVSMSRAILKERRNLTPRWYRIDEIETPPTGEIWVKDIDGTETIAVCKGKALIYPASSSMKPPEFWKPV